MKDLPHDENWQAEQDRISDSDLRGITIPDQQETKESEAIDSNNINVMGLILLLAAVTFPIICILLLIILSPVSD